jgi:general secretion pathway protein G
MQKVVRGKRPVSFNRPQREGVEGFTLIELLVVLVILGLLAGLVGPRVFSNVDKAKVQTAETQIKMLKGAIQTFRLDTGRVPTTQEGLDALVQPPQDASIQEYWQGPYLEDGEVPDDPWHNPYHYKKAPSGAQPFSLYSLGADGERGGDGFNADIGYFPES